MNNYHHNDTYHYNWDEFVGSGDDGDFGGRGHVDDFGDRGDDGDFVGVWVVMTSKPFVNDVRVAPFSRSDDEHFFSSLFLKFPRFVSFVTYMFYLYLFIFFFFCNFTNLFHFFSQ